MSQLERSKVLLFLVLLMNVSSIILQILVMIPWDDVDPYFIVIIHSLPFKVFHCAAAIISTIHLSNIFYNLFQKDDVIYVENGNYTYDEPYQYDNIVEEKNNRTYLHSIF